MRAVTLAAAAGLAMLAAVPSLASDKTDVMAVVDQMTGAFNKGDMTAWSGLCTDNAVIIDNMAPYIWQGPNACANWWNDFEASSKKNDMNWGKVSHDKPWNITVSGDEAYAALPTRYAYKHKGKAGLDHGSLTFAFHKLNGSWRIAGWTWSAH